MYYVHTCVYINMTIDYIRLNWTDMDSEVETRLSIYPMAILHVPFSPLPPSRKAERNCSRQASRECKGPGALKEAVSWPEGV